MLVAALVTCGSVALGTLLALFPRNRQSWMGPVRTFALTAALSVVGLHLLPESLASVGAWALLAFFIGLVAPQLLGKLGEFLWRAGHEVPNRKGEEIQPERRQHLALEASYFGLLLHRVGDGVGLGVFTAEMHLSGVSGGVVAAMAAHAIPVVAFVVLTFDSLRGRGSAIKRAIGLAAASLVGVGLSQALPGHDFHEAHAYIAAFVGGTLLHVVTHDLAVALPKTPSARALDLLAAALGLLVTVFGREGHVHGDPSENPSRVFERALLDFAIETGPLLVLGLVVGALLAAWSPRLGAGLFRSRGVWFDAARGTVIGAPLPLCSCSVLPISSALVARGAAPAMVVSFLLATPELGVETFALSVRFLGWELAWLRLGGALLVAFFAAVVVGRMRRHAAMGAEEAEFIQTTEGTFLQRAVHAFDELLHHIGSWMVLGLVAAALLEVALPTETLAAWDEWYLQFLVVTLVAVPSYVCAPSATPLAAVLLTKGLSPGAVLVGLWLGPATNLATLVFLRRWFGHRGALVGVLTVVALAWIIGIVVDFGLAPDLSTVVYTSEAHEHSLPWVVAAGISGLIVLRAVYKAGVRGFLSTLVGDHGHAHGHGGHDHGHGPAGHEASSGHAHEHGTPEGAESAQVSKVQPELPPIHR